MLAKDTLNGISWRLINNSTENISKEMIGSSNKAYRKGYDIINNKFFVETQLFFNGFKQYYSNHKCFDNFEEYFNYLNGDIYTNCCYKFYNFEKDRSFIEKNKIDITKLLKSDSFITQTVDDVDFSHDLETKNEISSEELDNYNLAENTKQHCIDWIKIFNACNNYDELFQTVTMYKETAICKVDLCFFFFNYIFSDINNKDKFTAIMKYMSLGDYPEYKLINPLCSIYDVEEVLKNYKFCGGSKTKFNKRKQKLMEHIDVLKNSNIKIEKYGYFDEKTHFYCEETVIGNNALQIYFNKTKRYFNSFEEFIKYRNGNLKNCDISKDIKLNVDLSSYEIDKSTRLPPQYNINSRIMIDKGYNSDEGLFYVYKYILGFKGEVIKEEKFESYYFFDFIFYLKNDLSNADLLFCDGLENLAVNNNIDFSNARMTSRLCDKFNINYDNYTLMYNEDLSLKYTEQQEKNYYLMQNSNKDILKHDTEEENIHLKRISYITDLHLDHRIHNFNIKSENDKIYVIHKIIKTIVNESSKMLLIGGDVSSDFDLFILFITLLRKTIDLQSYNDKVKVFFVLGNHEFWNFNGKPINQIIEIYREVIEKNGMYLIHNELFCMNSSNNFIRIPYERVLKSQPEQLRNQLLNTRFIIFGGIGFSGYDEEFNANNGIYRSTISRQDEIQETKKFENLYNFLTPVFKNKNVIVFTHMPINNWCECPDYKNKFVYISGHTHRNEFFDDGDCRVYSDNQVGYYNENPHLKSFLIDCDYDCFEDYSDGIYKISASQYNDFYRGKNIQMTFTREVKFLYMLKKHGYYCFIFQGKTGSFSLMHGGSLLKLDKRDVNYYYENMDKVILYINDPLTKYMNIQRQISKQIQKIGGRGKIHGCIIDIDFYNHIFVNPEDLTVKGYWAKDIVNKVVYPDIPSLIKDKCPLLYTKYLKFLENDDKNSLTIMKKSEDTDSCPKEYLDTTMYKASRKVKKMQRVNLNILTVWYDDITNNCFLQEKSEN